MNRHSLLLVALFAAGCSKPQPTGMDCRPAPPEGKRPACIIEPAEPSSKEATVSLPVDEAPPPAPGPSSTPQTIELIREALGPRSGLVVRTDAALQASIETLASEGLGQLQEISNLLLLAAVLAMAAAITAAVWQRRGALAGLRLCGVSSGRLRRILLVEAGLMLSAGCVTAMRGSRRRRRGRRTRRCRSRPTRSRDRRSRWRGRRPG